MELNRLWVRLFYWGENMETWPFWKCISAESLAKLILYQGLVYGYKLELLPDIYGDVEKVDEIDQLMRERPHYSGKVWFGG